MAQWRNLSAIASRQQYSSAARHLGQGWFLAATMLPVQLCGCSSTFLLHPTLPLPFSPCPDQLPWSLHPYFATPSRNIMVPLLVIAFVLQSISRKLKPPINDIIPSSNSLSHITESSIHIQMWRLGSISRLSALFHRNLSNHPSPTWYWP